MLLTAPPDRQLKPGRKRVHNRDSDAVQAARNLVRVLVELSACMELGHDHFGRGDAFLRMDLGWNATAIILHGHGTVGVQRHRHIIGITCERLVDGVVDNLVDHVMEARAVVRIADIHTGTLADRIEPFQDLDAVGAIGFRRHVHASCCFHKVHLITREFCGPAFLLFSVPKRILHRLREQ